MTNSEIRQYKKELDDLVHNFNSRKVIQGLDGKTAGEVLEETKKLHKDFLSLAEKVRASKCIGTGIIQFVQLISSSKDSSADKVPSTDIQALQDKQAVYLIKRIEDYEPIITELIFGINNALQTESMLKSSDSAKWACVWAAVAAGVAFIGTLANWIIIFKK